MWYSMWHRLLLIERRRKLAIASAEMVDHFLSDVAHELTSFLSTLKIAAKMEVKEVKFQIRVILEFKVTFVASTLLQRMFFVDVVSQKFTKEENILMQIFSIQVLLTFVQMIQCSRDANNEIYR